MLEVSNMGAEGREAVQKENREKLTVGLGDPCCWGQKSRQVSWGRKDGRAGGGERERGCGDLKNGS